ncbi:MAG: transcriptional repressor [Candidatus Bipolaricaulota bacterium]|nr:MAG: transcriptional repressor [Candidatus Bipolaricaulota bacterium]
MEVDSLIECLRAAGKRITPERVQILRVIADHPHADAREIFRIASAARPKLSLATVYRTANLLHELGIAEASGLGEGHRHFEARGESHYHCVCVDCGAVVEIDPVPEVRKEAERHGFRVIGESVELTGSCASCQGRTVRRRVRSAVRRLPLPDTSDSAAMERLAHRVRDSQPGVRLQLEAHGEDAEAAIADVVRTIRDLRLVRLERRHDRVIAHLARDGEVT